MTDFYSFFFSMKQKMKETLTLGLLAAFSLNFLGGIREKNQKNTAMALRVIALNRSK